MKKSISVVLVLVCAISIQSFASISYTGTLTVSGGELDGTGFWVTNNGEAEWFPAVISWTVSQTGNLWHYEYNLDVYRADISHFILETSPSFEGANLLNPNPFTSYEITTHEYGSAGNPELPGDIYGAKFDIGIEGVSEPEYTSITVAFDSDRAPVWGDFYAKCGKVGGTQNTLWNEGFLLTDPLNAPSNGTVSNHILVPDTIPEPATLLIMGLAVPTLLLKRNRR